MSGLRLEGVSKRFESVEALKGVSLDIPAGEFLALVGPSGCGKSTLLRIIAGLERQSAGRVLIGERAVDHLAPAQRDIAMVFQSYALYPHMTCFENMAVPLAMRRLSYWQRWPLLGRLSGAARRTRAGIADDVRKTARLLGIELLLARKPAEMSGGQRQRVALGRALVREPVLFLMDEPLSNLDAKLRAQTRVEIVELQRRLGITTVYVTHDQAEAMTMADRIAVIMEGELLQVGTPVELYRNPASLAVAEFIGSPKINVLAARVGAGGVIDAAGWRPGRLAGQPPGAIVFLGVRPEDLRILDATQPNALAGRIRTVEYLGSEVLLNLTLASGEAVVARAAPGQVERLCAGAEVNLAANSEAIHAFDAHGRRIPQSLRALGDGEARAHG